MLKLGIIIIIIILISILFYLIYWNFLRKSSDKIEHFNNITNPNITNPNITIPNNTNPNITNPNNTNSNNTNSNNTNSNITNQSNINQDNMNKFREELNNVCNQETMDNYIKLDKILSFMISSMGKKLIEIYKQQSNKDVGMLVNLVMVYYVNIINLLKNKINEDLKSGNKIDNCDDFLNIYLNNNNNQAFEVNQNYDLSIKYNDNIKNNVMNFIYMVILDPSIRFQNQNQDLITEPYNNKDVNLIYAMFHNMINNIERYKFLNMNELLNTPDKILYNSFLYLMNYLIFRKKIEEPDYPYYYLFMNLSNLNNQELNKIGLIRFMDDKPKILNEQQNNSSIRKSILQTGIIPPQKKPKFIEIPKVSQYNIIEDGETMTNPNFQTQTIEQVSNTDKQMEMEDILSPETNDTQYNSIEEQVKHKNNMMSFLLDNQEQIKHIKTETNNLAFDEEYLYRSVPLDIIGKNINKIYDGVYSPEIIIDIKKTK